MTYSNRTLGVSLGVSWADLLAYDPICGVLIWTVRRGFTKPGDVAGSVVNGYYYLTFNGKRYRGDAIAWELMTGKPPKHRIKPANGDRGDIRWLNIYHRGRSDHKAPGLGFSLTERGVLVHWFDGDGPRRSQHVENSDTLREILDQWVAAKCSGLKTRN